METLYFICLTNLKLLEPVGEYCSGLVDNWTNNVAKIENSSFDCVAVPEKFDVFYSKAEWLDLKRTQMLYVAVILCFVQCVSVIQCFTPIAQPAAGLTPEANKRKHDRNCMSQNCSKTTTVSVQSQTSVIACLWVGVTWQWAGWWQWLVYHLSPVEPTRPYAQTEGGWATEP